MNVVFNYYDVLISVSSFGWEFKRSFIYKWERGVVNFMLIRFEKGILNKVYILQF